MPSQIEAERDRLPAGYLEGLVYLRDYAAAKAEVARLIAMKDDHGQLDELLEKSSVARRVIEIQVWRQRQARAEREGGAAP